MIMTKCTPQGATQVSVITYERKFEITHTGNKMCELALNVKSRCNPTIVKLNMSNDSLIELKNGILEFLDKSTRGPMI
jgi:hypothetical protein